MSQPSTAITTKKTQVTAEMAAKMEYKPQPASSPTLKIQPRLIIHGGAGNITPATLTPERYAEFRTALLTIVRPRQVNPLN